MTSRATLCWWSGVVLVLAAGDAEAQSTTRVSVSSSGAQGTADSFLPSISADGRWVVFVSEAWNLVAGDTNWFLDVFVHDRRTGTTERVSIGSAGAQANGDSSDPSISGGGRFVAFESLSTNFLPGDSNACYDIFVHDCQTGTTERVSVDSAGAQANSDSRVPSISADGRFVVFESWAANLVPGDTNVCRDIFVRDRLTGTTERLSVDSAGAQANGNSAYPASSADGRFIAFHSEAANLVAGDTNTTEDVFVRDRQSGTIERVSVDSAGVQTNGPSYRASISADGRFVAFESNASHLVPGDTNGWVDVFVHDRQSGTTERVNLSSAGSQGNAAGFFASISADGRTVAFTSTATNLVAGDTNGRWDVFVHDRQSGTTERVSVGAGGTQGDGDARSSGRSSISGAGRYVAFAGTASNWVAGDTNGLMDAFVRDRGTSGPGTDLCQAGTGGVIACPCSNPPANSPRGCDNSSATGGAQLASSGAASLASDSLVFVTNGERPIATSVVLQGDAEVANGFAFGQGVRCVGGSLKGLYVKTAAGGSITAPGAGDPSVSARSAARGDPLQAGASRWYAVCYRDPIVLGGCASASTFDITQTQLVVWAP